MATFITIVLSISGLIHWFLYARFVSAFSISQAPVLWLLRSVALLLAVSYMLARWLEFSSAPDWLVRGSNWAASIWLGMMLQFLWMCLLAVFVKMILVFSGYWVKLGFDGQAALGRYSGLGIIAACVLICLFAISNAHSQPRINRYNIPVKNIPVAWRDLTIVHVADLHCGVLIREAQLRKMVDAILAVKPSMVLIPGDIVDAPPAQLEELVKEFQRLRVPYGVFCTTGNHEYYVGLNGAIDILKRGGLFVLPDMHTEFIKNLVIAGISDRTAKQMGLPRPTVTELLSTVDRNKFTILLNHTPATGEVREAIAAGADLVLSGHTHGGQLWPFNYLVKLSFPYIHGLYQIDGGRLLTTCGIGYWGPPMRLGAPPEINVIKLVGEGEE